jgi:DNA polymerase III alpha subunit
MIPTSRSIRTLLAALCLLAIGALAHGETVNTTPSAILANPDRFDGQPVVIGGTITNLQERVSRAGNSYYTLDLSDGRQAIRVFSFGKAVCRAGRATVEGAFEKVKRQGRYTFYNEVTATRMTCP